MRSKDFLLNNSIESWETLLYFIPIFYSNNGNKIIGTNIRYKYFQNEINV